MKEKANISQAERNELKQLSSLLVKQYNNKRSKHERETNY